MNKERVAYLKATSSPIASTKLTGPRTVPQLFPNLSKYGPATDTRVGVLPGHFRGGGDFLEQNGAGMVILSAAGRELSE